jgi:hypothetical protein
MRAHRERLSKVANEGISTIRRSGERSSKTSSAANLGIFLNYLGRRWPLRIHAEGHRVVQLPLVTDCDLLNNKLRQPSSLKALEIEAKIEIELNWRNLVSSPTIKKR